MQIFIRIVVILFVIPLAALIAGLPILYLVLPSLGVEPSKHIMYLRIIMPALVVGAIWLYVRSWKKTAVRSADADASQPSTSLRSGFVWALAIVIGGPFLYAMVQSSSKDAERKRQPGYAEFQDADILLTGSSKGIAHGNTADAQKLANEFSLRLKEARKMGIESRKSSSIVSLTGGEFPTYCLLTRESCVFMVHVPDLRNFSPEAKDFIAEAAWITAMAVIEPFKANLRDVAVGLRGALFYDRVVTGRLDATGNLASVRPGQVNGDTEGQTFLQSRFVPRSSAESK
jgi:hypothetical protein